MSILRTIGWIFSIIYATIPSYWLLVHPFIRRWRARRARLMTIGPFWMVLWIIVAAITWPWRTRALYTSSWAWLPALALFAAGMFVYVKGHQDFSHDQVLGRSELEPDRHEQRLVANGIRARIRHPYYLGHFCELLGWAVGTGLALIYALIPFAVVTGILMVRQEERELLDRFGDQYRDYMRRVPAFFPKFFGGSTGPLGR